MVILRLRRGGRRHSPHYRIVAQEKRSKLNGAYIESVGHYHPADKKQALVIDADKVKIWLAKGAALSDTVNNLLVKEGILPKTAKISRVYSPKPKDAEEGAKESAPEKAPVEAEAKAETKDEAKEETKTEETVEVLEVKEEETEEKKDEKKAEVAEEPTETVQ